MPYEAQIEGKNVKENETSTADLLRKVPHLAPVMQQIEKAEFSQEMSRLSVLIVHMYEDPLSTSAALNRVIMYTLYNCICKTHDTKLGFLILFNRGILAPAFLLSRSIFELWAAACFVEKTIVDFRTQRNEAKLVKIANKLFAGARYPAELPWGEPSTEKPVHINEMLAELEQRHPGAGDTYGFLCEYCHPNFLYNTEAYLASHQEALWENVRFRDSLAAALERQLSSLCQSLCGIKASARAVSDMCLDEYGVVYPGDRQSGA